MNFMLKKLLPYFTGFIKSMYFFTILLWIIPVLNAKADNSLLDSLYKNADIVLTGRITDISTGYRTEDLGTEIYTITIANDSVYKQNYPIDTKHTKINWVLSNLVCFQNPLSNCLLKYKSGKWIFFLTQAQMNGGEEITDNHIFSCDTNLEKALALVADANQLVVNHFYRDKICGDDCELCNSIKTSQWKKVEKYIANHSNDKQGIGWMQHQRIKWTLTDRAILSSLPSSCGTRFLFVTDTSEVEAYAGFQVGYVKNYASWRVKWFKHLRIEKTDTLILKLFLINTNYSKQYLEFERAQYTRMTVDTALYPFYSSTIIPIPDDLVLEAAVFDGELQFYEDYKSMPDYMQRAVDYIDTLAEHKKVYLLCIMTTHTSPVIATYSLKALEKLMDVRCIPFLIQLSQDRNFMYASSAKAVEEQEKFQSQLSLTLDALTGCITQPEVIPSDISGTASYYDLSISVWKKKIKMVDFEQQSSR
jgi:hypothetical protein